MNKLNLKWKKWKKKILFYFIESVYPCGSTVWVYTWNRLSASALAVKYFRGKGSVSCCLTPLNISWLFEMPGVLKVHCPNLVEMHYALSFIILLNCDNFSEFILIWTMGSNGDVKPCFVKLFSLSNLTVENISRTKLVSRPAASKRNLSRYYLNGSCPENTGPF